jgi:rSAM/selenodomain-associated transferase 1
MGSSGRPPDPVRVVVFAKAPVAGAVKTRLAPILGLEGAARLHARLVDHVLAQAIASGVGAVELWCAPDAAHPFFADCARRYGVVLRTQSGETLGERMHHACAAVLAEGARPIVVGSDCPALDAARLREAAAALALHDAVIAPAEDGGYGLIGLGRAAPALFEGIAWGTGTVMAETRERLHASGLRWLELPRTWDVDRPEDYARLQREGLLPEEAA